MGEWLRIFGKRQIPPCVVAAQNDAIHAINLLRDHRDQLDADLAVRFDAVLARRYPRR